MNSDTYDIQKLVQETGTPRRTIYFYVQQGLLPPPQGAGLAAHYTQDHLLRLQLIPILRQQGLRLDEIRARFETMNADEMRRLVSTSAMTSPASRASAGVPGVPAPAALSQFKPESGLPGQPVPAPLGNGTTYLHYTLPGGVLLAAPAGMSPADRQRFQLLLQAAQQIFSGSNQPFYAVKSPLDPASISKDEPRSSQEE